MGVLDFFVEREKKPDKSKRKPDLSAVGIPDTHGVADIHISPVIATVNFGQVDDEAIQITNQLRKELRGDGDYSKFLATKEALAVLPSENLRYVSAFAALSVGGLTKEKLLSSVQQYSTKVEKEAFDFDKGYETAYQQQVGNAKVTLENKSKELASLVEKMNSINSEIKELKRSSEDTENKLSSKKIAFHQAANVISDEIRDEISKINQYIK